MKYNDQIEAYLDGEMTAQEKQRFESELDKDKELNSELELRRQVNQAISESDVLDLRATLRNIHHSKPDAISQHRKGKLFGIQWQYAAAAIFGLLLVSSLTIYLLNVNRAFSSQELYSMYYQPDDAVMVMRSGETDSDNLLVEALTKYEQQDYEGALQLFKKDQSNLLVHFYSGLAYMEIDKFEEAIHSFQVIIDNNDNLFIEQAKWYQALSYLKIDEKDKAKLLFQDVTKYNSIYKDKAQHILAGLK